MLSEDQSIESIPIFPDFKSSGSILIVDDDLLVRTFFSTKLEANGFSVECAENLSSARTKLKEKKFRAVLLDLYLDDGIGLDLMGDILSLAPHCKIVILTANASIEYAIKATNKGASGFLVKTDLPDENISKFKQLIAEEIPRVSHPGMNLLDLGIIGTSKPLQALCDKIDRLRTIESTVLIGGESGTGKELFARAIHKLSNRASGPFIAINCAAISEQILESELFGYKRGAFTDAKQDRKGYFEACSQGTLFLDEIGEMSPGLQSKLLRVLQEKEVTPVGSVIPVPINTRIVAATNRDLDKEIAIGNFRRDLYYRLAVFQLNLPALRERKDDIPQLTEHFVNSFNKQYSRNVQCPSKAIQARMQAYDWPGNIRELHNALERAVVLAPNNEMQLEDLLPNKTIEIDKKSLRSGATAFYSLEYKEAKDSFERNYIDHLLHETSGNVAEAARLSKQYRPNIYRLINKFKIDPGQFKKN